MSRILFTDVQRRARLASRQRIGPHARVDTPLAAAEAMTALHATEAASVHLSAHARVHQLTVSDVDHALYADRSLVKQLAMRQTLFAFPRELLPAVLGSASARVAGPLRRTLASEVVRAGLTSDGNAWLAEAGTAIRELIAAQGPVTAAQVRAGVAALAGTTSRNPGTKWGGDFPIAPRVLTLLGAEGILVRAENAGHWRLNKPAWTLMSDWLGETPEPLEAADGYRELVGRWLTTFAPGTEADLVWWLGATKTAVRRALADLGAVEVDLEGGGTGYVLPDDLALDSPGAAASAPVDVGGWPALLPSLDPTTMGYRDRAFYLDPEHVPYLFDTVGNGGATAWWDGRIVGCWAQTDDGRVRVLPRVGLPRAATRALAVEADRLTAWLDGVMAPATYRKHQLAGSRLP